ncbi:MAG: 4a-hydroxytetrahydrobiopterin dehydratase [Acidimicrobiales bacterium]
MTSRPVALDDAALAAALAAPDAPRWDLVDGMLIQTFECPSFSAALDFVMAVGRLAEEADHHPDIDIRWRKVRLALVTHDAGGLTELDLTMARDIDALTL